jgi:hypothetical protein
VEPPNGHDEGSGEPPRSPFESERTSKPMALQLELPAAMPARSPAATREEHPPFAERARRHLGLAMLLVAAGVALTVVAIAIVLPGYVRRTCIERAAAHGITLAIDDVSIRSSGFVLHGVKAGFSDLPDARIEAPVISIETSGFTPTKLSASEMEITAQGRWGVLSAALERWRASEQGGQGGAWAPTSVVLDGSRVVWSGALGDQARIEAAGLHLDAAWSGSGARPTFHATSSLVTLVVPAGTLGPWRVDLDRDAGLSRARVALDPGVPEASTILLVGNDDALTSADVAVPRSPMARLGVTPSFIGLRGSPQVEVHLHWVPFSTQAAATATTRGGVYGVTVDGIPQPIDVTWDVKASGEAGVADMKQSKVAVGPLVGPLKGTLKTYPDGFRVDAAWSAGPVPCAVFDKGPEGPGAPLDFGYQIRKLAQSAGLTTLTGTVSASAMLIFDSRELGATTLAFTPNSTCDLAIGK